jgi:hypothetical protein
MAEWLRHTQVTKKFPKPKYGFTTHLKHIGDEVETFPMTKDDVERIKYAAFFWAWNKNYKIKFKRVRAAKDMWTVRITLVQKHRLRDYS